MSSVSSAHALGDCRKTDMLIVARARFIVNFRLYPSFGHPPDDHTSCPDPIFPEPKYHADPIRTQILPKRSTPDLPKAPYPSTNSRLDPQDLHYEPADRPIWATHNTRSWPAVEHQFFVPGPVI